MVRVPGGWAVRLVVVALAVTAGLSSSPWWHAQLSPMTQLSALACALVSRPLLLLLLIMAMIAMIYNINFELNMKPPRTTLPALEMMGVVHIHQSGNWLCDDELNVNPPTPCQ